MTGGDNPRERADGWFDIRETTTVDGLQRRLDGSLLQEWQPE